MKFIQSFILFIGVSTVCFAQNKIIDKSNFYDENSLHKGKVKFMTVKKSIIRANSDKKDTLVILKSFEFSKNQTLTKQIVYDQSIDKEYNIVEYYKNGEIKHIFRNENGSMMLLRTQLFKKNNSHPYRINEYYASVLAGFYISTFKNKLLKKQEHFIKNTLSEWNEYLYDKKNRIIPNYALEKKQLNLSIKS